MLDEMDASVPEVLVMLNAAIANGYFDFPVGRINAHENFRVIAAGNTVGTGADIQYTGRYQLDAASLNRFALVFMDYDEDIEMALADNDKEIVEFTHEFREACIKSHISTVVSYRQIDYFTKIKDEFSIEDALKMIYLKGIGNDDLQIIVNQIAKSSNKYSKIIKNIYG